MRGRGCGAAHVEMVNTTVDSENPCFTVGYETKSSLESKEMKLDAELTYYR